MEHLPAPSMWPATVGAAVSLMAFGVATNLALSALGLVLLAFGLYRWIQELRHG
jgi:Zn-dependent protease